MSWLSLLLGKLPVEWTVGLLAAGGLALLGGLGGAYLYIDHQGYARADLQWRAKFADYERQIESAWSVEVKRQAAVNEAAKASEQAAILQLERQLADQSALVAELQQEAEGDPDGAHVALDAAAAARHNRRAHH